MHLVRNSRRRVAAAFVAGLLALGAVGCSNAAEADSDLAGGNSPAVVVEQMSFSPASVTVPAGTTVTWTWDSGGIAHDVVGDDFASDALTEGSFSHRFETPGTYEYVCSLHPNMTATIEVTS